MNDPELTAAFMQFAIALLGLATAFISIVLMPKLAGWLKAEEERAVASGNAAHVETEKALAQSAVLWAEQYLSGAQGQAKREAAVDWLYARANDNGITIKRTDAEKLVEEAVRLMQAAGLDTPKKPTRKRTRKPAAETETEGG